MEHPKILIVEDDEDLHVLYGLYLQGQDYQVLRAFNGQEALHVLEKQNPDLIILDMIMPVMDGEQFFVKLRTEKKLMVPVIIASVNDKIPQKLFDLNHIASVLKKPFTIDRLLSEIEDALNGRK